jgi:hypothetical protein
MNLGLFAGRVLVTAGENKNFEMLPSSKNCSKLYCGWYIDWDVNVGHHQEQRMEIKIYCTQLPASGYANLKPIIFNCTE